MVEIIGIKEIMEIYGFKYSRATTLVKMKGCPLLKRVKNAPYEVPKEEFDKWLANQKR